MDNSLDAPSKAKIDLAEHLSSLEYSSAYPHPVDAVHWRETHISWVILTGRYAYKIKKPVDFGFLNFSTLSLRKRFCEQEVRLNQRTAPDWYLGVEPVWEYDGKLNFLGQGNIVDYAVKMVQFDPDALLSNVLADQTKANAVGSVFFQRLGYDLAQFHLSAEPATADSEFGRLESIEYAAMQNFEQILPRIQAQEGNDGYIESVSRLASWTQQQLKTLTPYFKERKKAGKVLECHGDLHLGNIAVLNDKAVAFDCIEFNDGFRWIDSASDLAFLIMDMEYNGYGGWANQVLNSYLEYSFDYDLLRVLTFYKVYRAMVRAKVALLRLDSIEPGGDCLNALAQFKGYIEYGLTLLNQRPPFMLMTSGVSGSGKSTFARSFCANEHAIHLRSDVVRKQVAGLKPLDTSNSDINTGIYTAQHSDKTFHRLQQITQKTVEAGYSVVVDATFLTQKDRRPFIELAINLNVPFVIGFLHVPTEELIRRIERRNAEANDSSEATVEVMEKQQAVQERFSEQELPHCVIAYDDKGEVNSKAIQAVIAQQR